MSTAREHYEAGRLSDAVAAATEDVKKNPTDTAKRGLLCELLCFAGDLERADKQLDAIGHQEAGAAPAIIQYRQLIRAEQARQDFFNQGRLPEFVEEPSPWLRLHIDASIRIREGNHSEAADLLRQAEEQRPRFKGVANGKAFEDFRDLDDLTAPVFEVLTSSGKYFWIPVDRVESIEFQKPERMRDLVWRKVLMTVSNGPDGEVFLPALYPGTASNSDDRVRLGRVTDWTGGDGAPARGIGQRMFLIGDNDCSILELETLEFEQPEGSSGEHQEAGNSIEE